MEGTLPLHPTHPHTPCYPNLCALCPVTLSALQLFDQSGHLTQRQPIRVWLVTLPSVATLSRMSWASQRLSQAVGNGETAVVGQGC